MALPFLFTSFGNHQLREQVTIVESYSNRTKIWFPSLMMILPNHDSAHDFHLRGCMVGQKSK